jgi:hypothetical protein
MRFPRCSYTRCFETGKQNRGRRALSRR